MEKPTGPQVTLVFHDERGATFELAISPDILPQQLAIAGAYLTELARARIAMGFVPQMLQYMESHRVKLALPGDGNGS